MSTTFEQWRALMPARGEQRQNDDDGPIDGAELWGRKYGSAETVISIPLSWPGLVEPEDVPDAVDGRERKRLGRWVLDQTGLVCLGEEWDISDERFDELDWLAHVLGKNWCYDPTDFFDALQEHAAPSARASARTGSTMRSGLRFGPCWPPVSCRFVGFCITPQKGKTSDIG